MRIILVPGFWLDASAWDAVAPVLRDAGHDVIALTLPGLESHDVDRSNIGFADHVGAVVRAIDSTDGELVLVGHSGGGPIVHAAADARLERIARVIHVDTWPGTPGRCINDSMSVVNGEIPFPAWDEFDDEDLVDMDEAQRDSLRARAVPQPAKVATDLQVLVNEARHDLPTTVIACEFPSIQLREWMADGAESLRELSEMGNVTYMDVPTGHWPMFTKPAELSAAINAAVRA